MPEPMLGSWLDTSTARDRARPDQEAGMTRHLARSTDSRAAAPVRIVHLGVGNFFRAHQAWYTEQAHDAGEWGIAAFTGRSAAIADELAPQEGLYTLVTQHPEGNQYSVIGSLSAVHPAADLQALRGYFASSDLAIVTSTVTEAGYRRSADGSLDTADPEVSADIRALRQDPLNGTVTTAPGKFVAGLLARRASEPEATLTFVPCDNISGNGEMVRRVVTELAAAVDPSLVDHIAERVSFVTTMVDRITPRPTVDDLAAVVADTGVDDPAAVVTEPFSEWVLEGTFPAGRPAWEDAGARFVDDIEPFETRKLYLLNGSHTLMAYAGSILGFQTVNEAIHDDRILDWVNQWWDVAARHLTLGTREVDEYRAALLERYRNPKIRHLLAQIAGDGSQKVPIRLVPTIKGDRTKGVLPTGALRAVAAWTLHLRGLGAPVNDARAAEVAPLADGSLEQSVQHVLEWLGLGGDAEVNAETLRLARELESLAGPSH
ncbi:mannitol dehydrogenase family protein [Aestuariimicrobium kwangyangense]|uniref:mannitol dehydrogenase family protein n=1 Tax=Aestuariimicrobium kwangyangense TaxID=396389 RepID=UPI001FE1BA8E|nr:mannitol dehydrogenase family protein [Aestuariimicrobium kwangyangense]